MTDRIEDLLRQARTEALQDVRPPGVDEVRQVVHRRRRISAGVAAVVTVAVVASGIAVAGDLRTDAAMPVTAPTPSPTRNLDAASAALGEPGKTPWVMATAGAVQRSYENQVNDIPAGDYDLSVYCAGEGTVDVVVKADRTGDTKLAAGSVKCSRGPAQLRLPVRQPVDGYLRVFLSGDARASNRSAFSFKFVRAGRPAEAGPATTANAARAVERLGVPDATGMTTERDKTVEKPRPAGDYLVSLACAGPGKLTFTVRSAAVLRDGTVATNGKVEKTVVLSCDSAANRAGDVAVTLPRNAALTVTAEADEAALGDAGWAYGIRGV